MGVFLQQKKVEKARKNGGLEAMQGFFICHMQVNELSPKHNSNCAGDNGGFVNRRKLWIMWISRCKTPFSLKKGKNGCAKLIHKTGDKMWIMWTTRKSNIYFVQLVWFTIKLAGWQKKKRFTWIGREAEFYSRHPERD